MSNNNNVDLLEQSIELADELYSIGSYDYIDKVAEAIGQSDLEMVMQLYHEMLLELSIHRPKRLLKNDHVFHKGNRRWYE